MLQFKPQITKGKQQPLLQTNLKVGQRGDKYEREADAVADRVMQMSESNTMQMQPIEEEEEMLQPKLRMQPIEEEEEMQPKIQLQEEAQAKCDSCGQEELIQMQTCASGGGDVAQTLQMSPASHIASCTGQAIPDSSRSFYESRFGYNFGNVKVHTCNRAVQMNRQLGAQAFTFGNNIFFNKGKYNQHSAEGKRLMAHELTHVVQQGAASKDKTGRPIQTKQKTQMKHPVLGKFTIQRRGLNLNEEKIQMKPLLQQKHGENIIQRDVSTPPPAVPAVAQPDLTDTQVQEAMNFNRRRYNRVGTRLIQNLLGGPVTGAWTAGNISAIAATQEQYGLTKDGKVGTTTFRFIDTEVRNETLARTDANCLTSLNIRKRRENIVARNNGATMTRQFFMDAQFPAYCRCRDFEYRQFIRGHFNHERAGVVTDEGNWFAALPAGRLNAAWQEDGHTGVPSVNFGYRSRATSADDRYLNDAGGLNRATGCRYRGEDTPGGNYSGWGVANPRTGDILDILVQFRGEIRRGGRVIRSKRWTALQRRFILPA